MSEQKRATLTSLGSTKKDKKSKELPKTERFTLTLAESNEEACPEFNYRVLLGSAERRRKVVNNARVDGAVNGLDPYASDDEDKLKDLARQFEEKYGGTGGRKRHGRFEDYVDLGAGYDENDPFIDNTDAYDEIVPEEITTAHGGFYINCGQLEFKEVVGLSDADEDRDIKIKKTLKKPKIKRTPLRGTNSEHPELLKKRKFVSHEREFLKKKKKLAIVDLRKKGNTVKELLREKRSQLESSSPNSNHSIVAESPLPQSPPRNISTSIPVEAKKLNSNSDIRKSATAMSIDDAIESVVSAARSNDDSSQDSSSSASKTGSGSSVSSDNSDDSQEPPEAASSPSSIPITPSLNVVLSTNPPSADIKVTSVSPSIFTSQLTPSVPMTVPSSSPTAVGSRGDETLLPSDLPKELVDLVTALKKAAESSAEGKCKFFSNDVNQKLLRVEQKVQALSCSRRQLVYGHLALYLPCTKDTLMKRAKKLRLGSEELKLKEPMVRLEAAIGRIMPGVLDQYTRLCQKVAEEKSNEEPSTDGTTPESKTRIPRKTFPWSSETRSLLQEVVAIKRQCILLQKPRKESMEELLRAFLEQSVKPLWPPGWMRLAVLCREAEIRSGAATARPVTASVNPPSTAGVAVAPTSVISTVPVPPLVPKPRKVPSLKKTTTVLNAVSSVPVVPPTCAVISGLPTSSSVSPPVVPRIKLEMQPPRNKPDSSSQPPMRKTEPISSQSQQLQPSFSVSSAGGINSTATSKGVKSVIERVPSKGLDLSITGATIRPVLPGSPTKLKGGSEISIIPMGVPTRSSIPVPAPPPAPPPPVPPPAPPTTGLSAGAGLPLINIPDCISVTPTMPPPQASSTAASSVRPMSLKHRILLDTGNQRSNTGPRPFLPPATTLASPVVPPSSPHTHRSDDGIEVIEITEEGQSTSNISSLPSPRARSEQSKKKARSCSEVSSPPTTTDLVAPMFQAPTFQAPTFQAPPERDAETEAATDLLSQIIHDSQPTYSNSGGNTETPMPPSHSSPTHHRSVIQRPPRSSPPKPLPITIASPVSAAPEQEPEVICDTPQPADAEESVQLEMDRVMKELIELQGHLSGEKDTVQNSAPQPSHSPTTPPTVVHVSSSVEPPKISSAVSVVPVPHSLSVRSTVSSTSSAGTTIRVLPREPEVTCTPLPRTRPPISPTVSSSADTSSVSHFSHSFQDEFQKHLFQAVSKGLVPKAGTGASETKKTFW